MRLLRPFLVAATLVASARPALADLRVFEDKGEEHARSLDLYGWIQPRFVKQQRDERDPTFPFTPNPAFVVQRFRLGGIAELDGWATARFELDLAGAGTPPLLDAYVVASPLPEFAFSVGQMRVPISRQNLLPSKSFQLPDAAYFVNAKFLHDRDMGAMVSGKVLDDRFRYFLGVFDGNEPGRGTTVNSDKYFMFAARLEASPLGAPPRFEGDLRPLEKRSDVLFNVSGSVMKNRLDDKHYDQTYYGADAGVWFRGASIYAEYFYKKSVATGDAPPPPPPSTTVEGWNVQAGYFLPVPWVEEHLEIVGRVQRFDPNKEVKHPQKDAGERDLDQSNPTWGYYGIAGGLNVFPTRVHEWKLQGSYEIRNETKSCLSGQSPPHCTGAIKNNLLVIQATGAFLVRGKPCHPDTSSASSPPPPFSPRSSPSLARTPTTQATPATVARRASRRDPRVRQGQGEGERGRARAARAPAEAAAWEPHAPSPSPLARVSSSGRIRRWPAT